MKLINQKSIIVALAYFGLLLLERTAANECPSWFYHPQQNTSECVCGDRVNGIVICDNVTQDVHIMKTFCVTPNSDSDNTLVIGKCYASQLYPLYPKLQTSYYKLPRNESNLEYIMCSYVNRRGRLCGKCKNNSYPPAYSYDFKCVQCDSSTFSSVVQYIGIAYIPLTLFFVFIFIFRINVLSPQLNCVVVVCQILTTPIFLRQYMLKNGGLSSYYIHIYATVYGIWNLDFFRTVIPPICLPLGPLYTLLLDYFVAFYPLFLLLVLYALMTAYQRNMRVIVWLFKPLVRVSLCFKRQWEIKSSFIDAFASFIVLSCMKALNTSADLLISVGVRDVHGSWKGLYLFIDPSTVYFGRDHLPFAIIAIIISSLWVVFGIGLLILYPMQWFQKCLNKHGLNSSTLRTFMQCFQGYYRDRTDGGIECRYYSAVYPVLRLVCFIIFGCSHNVFTSPNIVILLIITVLLLVFFTPYRHPFKYQNKLDVFLLLSISMFCVFDTSFLLDIGISLSKSYNKHFVDTAIGLIGCIPLIYFIVLVLLCIKKFVTKTLIPTFKRRQTYIAL